LLAFFSDNISAQILVGEEHQQEQRKEINKDEEKKINTKAPTPESTPNRFCASHFQNNP